MWTFCSRLEAVNIIVPSYSYKIGKNCSVRLRILGVLQKGRFSFYSYSLILHAYFIRRSSFSRGNLSKENVH